MSTPMWDMPDHFPMPVNADGDGPCSIEELDRVICWCPDPDCMKHLELDEPMPHDTVTDPEEKLP